MRKKFGCGHYGKGLYCHTCEPNKEMTKEEAQKRYMNEHCGKKEITKWKEKGWIN